MATKILDAHNLAAGGVDSSAVLNIGDLTIHAQVSGATGTKKTEYTLMAKEGGNNYTEVRNSNKEPVRFETYGNMAVRISVKGIESESAIVRVVTDPDSTGLLTIEALGTAKTAADL